MARKPAARTARRVTVRMYRGLLGDCFLLIHEHDGQTFRALIDCGVLQCIGKAKPETEKGAARLGLAVSDLIEHCAGRLDLVIVTHAHYDHLAGFILYNVQFAAVSIGAVWVGWTEDPDDELALAIRERRSRGLAALAILAATGGAAMGATLVDPVNAERMQTITDLLQFYGEIEVPPSSPFAVMSGAKTPSASARPRSCDAAITWLRGQVGEPKVRYLEPGQQVRFGVGGLLVANVLGPPRAERRLTQMDPTAGAGREVYMAGKNEVYALESTLRLAAGKANGSDIPATAIPFNHRFRRWEDGSSTDPLAMLYYASGNRDRRIDGEWLGTAELLALKIDGDVNNTSLALAIEVPGGDVLLFPGDAQVGNWLSWHDQRYPSKPAVTPESRTAAELLSRVVLYKAGHHLSHNATARELGLELMTSPDLVAMGPLVEKVAREQVTKSNPHGWAMPYSDLMTRLRAKTRGRIVRGDGNPADEVAAFIGSRFSVVFADETVDPLWVSLTLSHPHP